MNGLMIKPIYVAPQFTDAEQQDLQQFIQGTHDLRCLSQPDADSQVWLGHHRALVFKVFDIPRLKQRWRARWKTPCPIYGQRYGWAERGNAERFAGDGLPGLPVRAYLESSHPLLCARQVVAYPYLEGYTTLQQALEAGHSPFAALNAVEPAVLHMARSGVFHLDLNSRNVMLDAEYNVRIIDFEYMAWQQQQPGTMYAYYLGYLWQKWVRNSVLTHDYDQWFATLLDQRQPLFNEPEGALLASFQLGRERELSRSQRYRMFS